MHLANCHLRLGQESNIVTVVLAVSCYGLFLQNFLESWLATCKNSIDSSRLVLQMTDPTVDAAGARDAFDCHSFCCCKQHSKRSSKKTVLAEQALVFRARSTMRRAACGWLYMLQRACCGPWCGVCALAPRITVCSVLACAALCVDFARSVCCDRGRAQRRVQAAKPGRQELPSRQPLNSRSCCFAVSR